MSDWYALTLDEQQKACEHEPNIDQWKAYIANRAANVPLSPSVSGGSHSGSETEDGGRLYLHPVDEPEEKTLKRIRGRGPRALQKWNRYRQDYREKSGKANGTTFSPFSRLPFEIRRMIYLLRVKQTEPVVQMNPDGSGYHLSGPIDLRLALASKQLFDEVCRTFFEENFIQLDIMPNRAIGLPVLFNPGAKSAEFWPFEGIERVHVFVEYVQKEQSVFLRAEFLKLVNVLQRCSLIQLEITAFSVKQWFHEGLHESFDLQLAALETLKAQKLCFSEDLDTFREKGLNSDYFCIVGTKQYKNRLQGIVTRP